MRLPLATLALIALATAAHPLTPAEITLTGGRVQPIPGTGISLILTEVTDHRCPPGVTCVWEGLIRAEITVMPPLPGPQQITLCNLCEGASRSATTAGLTLTLVSLAPSTEDLAKLGRAPRLPDYELTVYVNPVTP